jgi:FkbM family methyltransferase
MTRVTGAYEQRFSSLLEQDVRAGDCVWDVGANVGDYTVAFAALATPAGRVIAVEPSPACAAELEARVGAEPGVTVLALALSDFDGEAQFSVADGPSAVSNRLAAAPSERTVKVPVFQGDTLIGNGYPAPNVLKIDVEGFEGEVLNGLSRALSGPSLRSIFLEMHFSQLADRGLEAEPARIVELLSGKGFRIEWVDQSHLVARR